jgi:acyl-CoA synthetase (AMP-forming)/AMP-acid ligase II
MLCGGERLPRDLASRLLATGGELWNMYGPTETTIWSTVGRVAAGPAEISIGRPIANTTVYVVDRHGEPVPIGVPGEILIGGAGVALGYHNRPDLTAERFVEDPFSSDPAARLYCTGDVARWGADGRLYHLGRFDHQVKIRGFRIELGEIEAALAEHDAVRQALVVAHDAGNDDRRLVAYVVFADGEDLTASDVRRFLRRRLPDYMIPSLVVALPSMPLTPNGKVDRSALPDPFRDARETPVEIEPPAPGLETLLATIWREVLQVGSVGAHDNFFELGGHSLLTLRVARLVETQSGHQLDPRQLFYQNLRQVAATLETTGGAT